MNKVTLLDCQSHGTDLTAWPCPGEHRKNKCHNNYSRASFHQGSHHDQNRQRRDYYESIRDNHQHSVQCAACKTCKQTNQNTHNSTNRSYDQTNHQRIVNGFDQQPDNILSHTGSSKPMFSRNSQIIRVCIIGKRICMWDKIYYESNNQEKASRNQACF